MDTTHTLGAPDGFPSGSVIVPRYVSWEFEEVKPYVCQLLYTTLNPYCLFQGTLDMLLTAVLQADPAAIANHLGTFRQVNRMFKKFGLELSVFPSELGLFANDGNDPHNADYHTKVENGSKSSTQRNMGRNLWWLPEGEDFQTTVLTYVCSQCLSV